MSRLAAALAFTLLASACGAAGELPPPPLVATARFPTGDTSGTAEEPLGGRLILQGDCLLVSRIDRQLAIWPEGYSFRDRDMAVLRPDGSVLTRVGGWVWGDTATMRRTDVEQLVGAEVPTACGGGGLGEDDYLVFERIYDHKLPGQTDLVFPVADTLGIGHAGAGRGPLQIAGDCVTIGGHLYVWPWWTSFDPAQQALVDERDGSVILRVGERIMDGGGGSVPRESAESLVGYELPERCGEVALDEVFFLIDTIETEAGRWEYRRAGPSERRG